MARFDELFTGNLTPFYYYVVKFLERALLV